MLGYYRVEDHVITLVTLSIVLMVGWIIMIGNGQIKIEYNQEERVNQLIEQIDTCNNELDLYQEYCPTCETCNETNWLLFGLMGFWVGAGLFMILDYVASKKQEVDILKKQLKKKKRSKS